jgi:hypothetical protein
MTFKNPSHQSHSSSPEKPSFNESEQEVSQEKQPNHELVMDESKNEEPLPVEDTTGKDNVRIGEIKSQIEESDAKHDRGLEHKLEATKKNREDIKRINALKRAAGEPVTQPKKESFWGGVKSFFGGKSE